MIDLCRLCAAVRKTDTLIPMDIDVCQKLSQCFGMEMCHPEDKLPRRVCTNCIEALQNAFNFFNKVNESQETLKILFDEPNKESSENIGKICSRKNNYNILKKRKDSKAEVLYEDLKYVPVVNGSRTNDGRLLTCPSSPLNEDIVEENDDNSDIFDVYQAIDTELDFKVEGKVQEYDCKAGKSPDQFSESSMEVETYFLEEEDDDIQKQESHDENQIEQNESNTMDNFECTLIEILPTSECSDTEECFVAKPPIEIRTVEWRTYSWICFSCSETCKTFSELMLHCNEKHDVVQYKCVDCQKICVHYNKFVNHVRFRHHPELILRCDACDIRKENYTELAAHRETSCMAAQSYYPRIDLCKICGKSFLSRSATMMHARNQHSDVNNEKLKWHQCAQCEKKFKRISSLRAHENIHLGLKEFSCEVCDRKFHQKINLEVHLHTHISDRTYGCKICKKSFKTTASLEKHQLVHTDIKNFNCDYCGKGFRTKDEKNSHQRIHTGEKPYKCQYCDRSFRFRSVLMGHISVHTGERPYSCQDCGRKFSNWGNMNKHLKRCQKRKDVQGTPA